MAYFYIASKPNVKILGMISRNVSAVKYLRLHCRSVIFLWISDENFCFLVIVPKYLEICTVNLHKRTIIIHDRLQSFVKLKI